MMYNIKSNFSIFICFLVFLVSICFFSFNYVLKAKANESIKISYNNTENIKETKVWPNKKLKNDFIKYWKYIYNGDLHKAFNMEAPHFKNVVKKKRYFYYIQHAQKNQLDEMVIKEIKENSKYNFDVIVLFRIKKNIDQQIETVIKDRWISLKGKWYHVITNPVFFPSVT